MDALQKQITGIFLPIFMRESARVRDENRRFVHYTSADTALKILRSKQMLLRNSTLMNDFSEVNHGWTCLRSAYNGELGDRLRVSLAAIQPDLPDILSTNFNAQIFDVLSETYLMSVSEHDDEHEEKFGRLSMWRAYAPKDGVALVMQHTPFLCESRAIGAYTSPVSYSMPEDFETDFGEIVTSVENNIDFLKTLGGEYVHNILVSAFRFAVQSTKHPSFKEEREWRVIYSPNIPRADGKSREEALERVPSEVMCLGGVPQRVYAIPFKDYPDEGFCGAAPPELLSRILIGPTQHSYAIQQAFIGELEAMNVPDAASKVVITGVPLRV